MVFAILLCFLSFFQTCSMVLLLLVDSVLLLNMWALEDILEQCLSSFKLLMKHETS